ncbi:MAG: hypothetical protein A3F83_13000 [Candidatus Glassbacteria bacterium RIFCSPLOWO2_12_FULL_58_11]|uniref:Putative regulatory protein FmdB zinc ribbon domain-containing protein n=1 Tax=Candidatus Glassbacteria bacterium RIFCSPLOWO2_12_FULL_58_11 TaxID=1817867 RepID=A0A1F5YXK8_9BACT|nr:MAG: hypothetical protein A3F83_13000 [Candidatus Glassbacteria bacterium RIFCSPLOWO2_12_FULL_58_11]
MPIYEYRCKSCGKVIEVLESSAADGKHVCPKCGNSRMERIFSAFGVEVASPASKSPCGEGSCGGGSCPYA